MNLSLLCLYGGITVLLLVSIAIDLKKYINYSWEAHPHHFLYPALFLMAGYVVGKNGDKPLDMGFYILGAVMAGWIVIASLRDKWTAAIEANTEYLKTYHRMSPEERAELGFMPSKDVIRIETIRRNENTGAYEGESRDYIHSSPAKFRLFCQGVLEDFSRTEHVEQINLTFAKWAGKGRLYTDPEFESLQTDLYTHKFITYKNGKTSDNGFIPTEAGIDFMRDFLGEARIKEEAEEILHPSGVASPKKE